MKPNKNVTSHSINVIYFPILSQMKFVVILIAVISTNKSDLDGHTAVLI